MSPTFAQISYAIYPVGRRDPSTESAFRAGKINSIYACIRELIGYPPIPGVVMVDISRETTEQTEQRLRRVITEARLRIYPETYAFVEFPLDQFPKAVRSDALALVRDDNVWSQLVPSRDASKETFGVFRFHFPAGADNSGFVGWLATHLKSRFGTGVFVTCGQNSEDGGIFDYWGVPATLADEVFEEVKRLVQVGK
ncbi:DUF6196 family protein [Pandoraea pulmonicola]|nr:DUF6196 family protein [Pandoraea pulmonicola]